MNQPVTWLIPVKNGMPYLPKTLASIQAQTYKNWQVLVWDNGSTDGTLAELKKWIPQHLPGRVITEKPLSLGASLAKWLRNLRRNYALVLMLTILIYQNVCNNK